MPTSSIVLAQWHTLTSQSWRRTRGRTGVPAAGSGMLAVSVTWLHRWGFSTITPEGFRWFYENGSLSGQTQLGRAHVLDHRHRVRRHTDHRPVEGRDLLKPDPGDV